MRYLVNLLKNAFARTSFAAQAGIDSLLEYNPALKVSAAATDPFLNECGYIVPGLGKTVC